MFYSRKTKHKCAVLCFDVTNCDIGTHMHTAYTEINYSQMMQLKVKFMPQQEWCPWSAPTSCCLTSCAFITALIFMSLLRPHVTIRITNSWKWCLLLDSMFLCWTKILFWSPARFSPVSSFVSLSVWCSSELKPGVNNRAHLIPHSFAKASPSSPCLLFRPIIYQPLYSLLLLVRIMVEPVFFFVFVVFGSVKFPLPNCKPRLVESHMICWPVSLPLILPGWRFWGKKVKTTPIAKPSSYLWLCLVFH